MGIGTSRQNKCGRGDKRYCCSDKRRIPEMSSSRLLHHRARWRESKMLRARSQSLVYGVRWQSAAATPLSDFNQRTKTNSHTKVERRLTFHSKAAWRFASRRPPKSNRHDHHPTGLAELSFELFHERFSGGLIFHYGKRR